MNLPRALTCSLLPRSCAATSRRRYLLLPIVAGAFSFPALACDLGGSYADAQKAGEGAEVFVQNNLAPGPLASRCVFLVKNVGHITVGYVHRPGRAPDSVYIVAPPGFIAVPPEAVLQEGESAKFLVVPEFLG